MFVSLPFCNAVLKDTILFNTIMRLLKFYHYLQLRTTQKYTWSQREVTEKGEPLMSVVDHVSIIFMYF